MAKIRIVSRAFKVWSQNNGNKTSSFFLVYEYFYQLWKTFSLRRFCYIFFCYHFKWFPLFNQLANYCKSRFQVLQTKNSIQINKSSGLDREVSTKIHIELLKWTAINTIAPILSKPHIKQKSNIKKNYEKFFCKRNRKQKRTS